MSSELPPTEYFSGINFNPDFYTTGSNYSTIEETKNLIIEYSSSSTSTISTLNTTNINAIGSTLNIGPNLTTGSAVVIGSDTSTQTSIKSSAIGLLGNTTVVGNSTTTGTSTSNAYNLSGTTPTLSKTSLNYYFNYPQTNTATLSVASKFLYSPSINSATTDGHYLPAGIYIAFIHMYATANGGPTYTGTFVLGASYGTSIQTMPVNSQYGTLIFPTSDITIANTTGLTFSHTGCFTLSSSAFVNLEFNLKTLTITSGTLTFYIYGCIKRIG